MKVVNGPMPYGMKYRKDGEEIEMPRDVAKIYLEVGRVTAVEKPSKRRRVYRRRDMQPAETSVMTAEPNE